MSNKLRAALSQNIPLIAASFTDAYDSALIQKSVEAGLDVAELRVDLFGSSEASHILDTTSKYISIPTILTIRHEREGGNWRGSEQSRLELYQFALPTVDGIDIELSSSEIVSPLVGLAREQGRYTIGSYHNFDGTPETTALMHIAEQARALKCDCIKIATHVESPDHLKVLANFMVQQKEIDLIVIGMGSQGMLTRIFFPALGSRITFAALEKPTAPGQLSFLETFSLLRRFYASFNQKKIDDLEIMEAV